VKKDKKTYQNSFGDPWCPLFGNLPEIDAPPSAAASRCLEIICEAREMWWIAADILRADNTLAYPLLSESVLNSIRPIYSRIWEIMFRAQWMSGKYNEYGQPRYDNPYYDDRSGNLKIAEDQVYGDFLVTEALQTAFIDSGVMQKVFEVCGSWLVFSLCAIHRSRDILDDLLFYGEEESSASITAKLLTASNVLVRAKKEIHETGLDEHPTGYFSIIPDPEEEEKAVKEKRDKEKKEAISKVRSKVATDRHLNERPMREAKRDKIRTLVVEQGRRRRGLRLNGAAEIIAKKIGIKASTIRRYFSKEEYERLVIMQNP